MVGMSGLDGFSQDQAEGIRTVRSVARAETVTDRGDACLGHRAEGGREFGNQGRSGRGDVLPRLLDLTEGDSPEQGQRGGGGEGECPVGAMNVS